MKVNGQVKAKTRIFIDPEDFKDLKSLKEDRPYLSLENIELIGISDTSFNITYNGPPPATTCAVFGVDNHVFCDYLRA